MTKQKKINSRSHYSDQSLYTNREIQDYIERNIKSLFEAFNDDAEAEDNPGNLDAALHDWQDNLDSELEMDLDQANASAIGAALARLDEDVRDEILETYKPDEDQLKTLAEDYGMTVLPKLSLAQQEILNNALREIFPYHNDRVELGLLQL